MKVNYLLREQNFHSTDTDCISTALALKGSNNYVEGIVLSWRPIIRKRVNLKRQ